MPSNTLPDIEVSFGDKIFHSLAYVFLTLLWFYSLLFHFKKSKIKSIVYACLFSIIFGIIIELLQELITKTRRADMLDVLANSLGVFIAASWLIFKKQ